MTGLTCLHCSADTDGVVLCKRCRNTLGVSLQHVASYHGDLFGLGSAARVRGRRRGEHNDPTGAAAGNVQTEPVVERLAAETTSTLVTWTRVLLDDRPGMRTPGDTVAATSEFLRTNIGSIATLEWAGEITREILQLEQRLHRTVSQNQGHWYAGICAARTGTEVDDWCPQDLFVHPGQNYIRCTACGHNWSVAERRRQIIEQAREALLPVSVIARAAVSLLPGEPSVQRLEARLRQWVQRNQLEDYGVRVLVEGQQPRRVYRLGDVIDRLTRDAGVAR